MSLLRDYPYPYKPMLVQTAYRIPKRGHIAMVKMDGFRCLLYYDQQKGIRLYTRHLNDCTASFPELQQITLPYRKIILDGEIVVLEKGKPNFEDAIKRLKNQKHAETLAKQLPAHFAAFDVLYLEGPLYQTQLQERLHLLNRIKLPEPLFVCPSHPNGEELFDAVKNMGLEGIVSKAVTSPWIPDCRPAYWKKTKNFSRTEVSILAIQKRGFGWLIGNDERTLGVLGVKNVPASARLQLGSLKHEIKRSEDEDWYWLHRGIRCIVKHMDFYRSGQLREPTFETFCLPEALERKQAK